MISVRDLCRRRCIGKMDLPTPMLVPSLSSKGFPDVGSMGTAIRDHLTDVAMVSSYDIFYGYIDDVLSPNLLFVDSGGYEARVDHDLSDSYSAFYLPREWSRERHAETVRDLDILSALALVSFDEVGRDMAISQQIEQAMDFFSQFQEAASDFLVTPCRAPFIDVGQLAANVIELSHFDVIGITEKELGPSTSQRLESVIRTRMALTEAGLDVPIHVVGCLNPLSVLLFYLCGADIFDGLSWLRFAFNDMTGIYRNDWTIIADYPDRSDVDVKVLSWLANLRVLEHLQQSMGTYATEFDERALDMDMDIIEPVLNSVGVTARREGG